MRKDSDSHKARHSERGVAIVEFAILVVLFLVIVFGLLEFIFMFFQKHYIAGAAREGVRVGVVANNFECFENEAGCVAARFDRVCDEVTEYLGSIVVFDAGGIDCTSEPDGPTAKNTINIFRTPEEGINSGSVELSVTVYVDNVMPAMLSGLVPGYTPPETFRHTATGTYEDANEP